MSAISPGLERDLQVFIDPNVNMSQDNAYGIVAGVWEKLDLGGYGMPEPPEQALREHVTLAPESIGQIASRAVAAPRLDRTGRQALADQIQAMAPEEFGHHGSLWTPYGSEDFTLGYQTADDKVVSGEVYEEGLIEAGRAVKGSKPDSPVWIFDGATDVQVHGRQTSGTFGQVFNEMVRPTATPEIHMLIQAIHRFTKVPRPGIHDPQIVEAVNEVIRKPDSSPVAPNAIAVVSWNNTRQLISLGFRPADRSASPDVRVR